MSGFASQALSSLQSIPKELWTPIGTLLAGVFTAVVAFVAVAMQNRSAERRHKQQLEHDSNERSIERLATLRRTVYLDSVEALMARAAAYMDLWGFDLDWKAFKKKIQKSDGPIARVYVLADLSTIKALQEASTTAMAVMPHALSVQLAFMKVKETRDVMMEFQERLVKKRSALTEKLQNNLLDDGERKNLEKEKENLSQSLKDLTEDIVDGLKRDMEFSAKALLRGHELLREHFSATANSIVEMRRELGQESDQAAMMKYWDESLIESRKQLEALSQEIIQRFRKGADTVPPGPIAGIAARSQRSSSPSSLDSSSPS